MTTPSSPPSTFSPSTCQLCSSSPTCRVLLHPLLHTPAHLSSCPPTSRLPLTSLGRQEGHVADIWTWRLQHWGHGRTAHGSPFHLLLPATTPPPPTPTSTTGYTAAPCSLLQHRHSMPCHKRNLRCLNLSTCRHNAEQQRCWLGRLYINMVYAAW